MQNIAQIFNSRMPQGQTKAVWTNNKRQFSVPLIMKWKWVILLLGILVLSAVIFIRQARPTHADVINSLFGGQKNFEVISAPATATAQRMHLRKEIQFDAGSNNPGKLNGYDLDPPISLTPEQTTQIQKLLGSPSSYPASVLNKACMPIYGVLFNFRSGQQTVRVALCFNCNIIAVFTGEDVDQSGIGSDDFDPARGKFANITKSIFPDDPEIKSLKEQNR